MLIYIGNNGLISSLLCRGLGRWTARICGVCLALMGRRLCGPFIWMSRYVDGESSRIRGGLNANVLNRVRLSSRVERMDMCGCGSLRKGTVRLLSLDLDRRLGRRKRRRIGLDRTNRTGASCSSAVYQWTTGAKIEYAECHEFYVTVCFMSCIF